MDDSSPLPEPTPELISTLREAAKVTDDDESRRQFERLLVMLVRPTRPTLGEVGAALTGEGTLSAVGGPPVSAGLSGEGALTAVGTARSTSWDVLESVTSARSTTWSVEADARESIDYAIAIAKWGGAALVIAKVIQQASETVVLWINTLGQ